MNLLTIPLARPVKQTLWMLLDGLLLASAWWLAGTLVGLEPSPESAAGTLPLLLAIAAGIVTFSRIGIYRTLLLYMGLQGSLVLLRGVSLVTVYVGLAQWIGDGQHPQYAALGVFWMMALLLVGGVRILSRLMLQSLIHHFRPKEPVIIYGAGSSGMQLVVALQNGDQYLPVAFVDDSRHVVGNVVHGIRVYSPGALTELIETFAVRQILLAVPSATHAQRKEILNRLEHLPVHVKTVPDLFDMVSGKMGVDEVRDIDIEDLLGRDIVPPNPALLGACIVGKSVMVTGAAGSIGSELCRQIVRLRPARLVVMDAWEYGLYEIENELQGILREAGEGQVEVVALLGSVCNEALMTHAYRTHRVDTVYHAAAYKQVPMVEKNVVEGVQNNVFGTQVAALAAARNGVHHFLLISTDKAVRPTNVMGATKRFAEQVLQALSQQEGRTCFSMVRFGNVLGSSGSVVPLFRRQIAQGGPVTVTHPEVTRYFMTVQEAAQLVIQAGSMATGGDVFVLDMHEPIRIVDLARKMIHLMGYEIKEDHGYRGDIAIEYTGLRPGEKLYEELLIGESVTGTHHPKILRAEEDCLSWSILQGLLERLRVACDRLDAQAVRQVLAEGVDGFAGEPADEPMGVGAGGVTDGARPAVAKVTPLFKR